MNVVFKQRLGRRHAVVRQSSGSRQAVVRQLSCSHHEEINLTDTCIRGYREALDIHDVSYIAQPMKMKAFFSNFSYMFLNPNNMNSNCSNLLDLRNLQEQVKKAFYYQKLF